MDDYNFNSLHKFSYKKNIIITSNYHLKLFKDHKNEREKRVINIKEEKCLTMYLAGRKRSFNKKSIFTYLET